MYLDPGGEKKKASFLEKTNNQTNKWNKKKENDTNLLPFLKQFVSISNVFVRLFYLHFHCSLF